MMPDIQNHLDAIQRAFLSERHKVNMLRKAIGVIVPSCLRCLIEVSKERDCSIDVDLAQKVLDRVEKAMMETKPNSLDVEIGIDRLLPILKERFPEDSASADLLDSKGVIDLTVMLLDRLYRWDH